MPFIHVPDADIYYELTGSGPPIIFAHGLGGNHLSWWQQVPYFSDRYTCVAFAHRGFNPSREAPDGPGPAAFVDDLAALIDTLHLSDVRLVAQSMGGWACLGYTLRHSDNVRALVMADTVGGLDHPDVARLRSEQPANARAELAARGIHIACGERMAREQPALHHLYKQVNDLSWSLDKGAFRAKLAAVRNAPTAYVQQLQVPLLCIAGEEDAVMPPAAAKLLASLVPGARFELVPRAGHSVYWERPAVFNHLLEDFFASS